MRSHLLPVLFSLCLVFSSSIVGFDAGLAAGGPAVVAFPDRAMPASPRLKPFLSACAQYIAADEERIFNAAELFTHFFYAARLPRVPNLPDPPALVAEAIKRCVLEELIPDSERATPDDQLSPGMYESMSFFCASSETLGRALGSDVTLLLHCKDSVNRFVAAGTCGEIKSKYASWWQKLAFDRATPLSLYRGSFDPVYVARNISFAIQSLRPCCSGGRTRLSAGQKLQSILSLLFECQFTDSLLTSDVVDSMSWFRYALLIELLVAADAACPDFITLDSAERIDRFFEEQAKIFMLDNSKQLARLYGALPAQLSRVLSGEKLTSHDLLFALKEAQTLGGTLTLTQYESLYRHRCAAMITAVFVFENVQRILHELDQVLLDQALCCEGNLPSASAPAKLFRSYEVFNPTS